MGEKIKDLHAITIGNASLMIELNEGYAASQGRLIHIQNEKFRYLLKEKEFLQLAGMVLRGWSEFDYLKSKPAEPRQDGAFRTREPVSADTIRTANALQTVFSGLRYRLLDLQEGLITVVVHPDYAAAAEKALKSSEWQQSVHPHGTEAGYLFLYQMRPFRLFRKGSCHLELFVQLPCASLTKKKWIPLDRSIQQFLWADEDAIPEEHWANLPCRFLYHLCWAVYFNRGFSSFERQFVTRNGDCVSRPEVQALLKTVFFGFTEDLIELIAEGKIDRIIPEYFSFREY